MDVALLSINHAALKLGKTAIFTNLNFQVNKGENWALVGESGSGKSALLQVIAGKFHLSGGNITYHFHEEFLQKHPQNDEPLTFHRLIALVESRHHFRNLSNTGDFYYQQRYNSSDSEDALTVEEYLSLIKPVGENPYWTLEKALQTLHLVALRNEQLIKLSNGETKRLLIAAALLKNPVILMLDNPLAGLDVQTRVEFNAIITEVIRSGITVIMATSLFEIPFSITHVAVLQNGTIAKQIPASQFDAKAFADTTKDKIDQR